jgi:hypothetical protein
MSSGDAYVYCLIIDENAADKINRNLSIIDQKQKKVNEILQHLEGIDYQDQVRGKQGLALLEEIKQCKMNIHEFCKNPIAIYYVADDSWNEAYDACSEAMYTPTSVSMFLNQTGGKIWCKDELAKRDMFDICLCLPSHHDTDEEFLESIGVTTRRLEDYNAHKRTEPILRTEYVLVSLSNGQIVYTGTLSFVAYEWARSRYEFGATEYEVREVEVREIRVVDKKELDKVVDETFGDETQYGINWHVDKHEEGED